MSAPTKTLTQSKFEQIKTVQRNDLSSDMSAREMHLDEDVVIAAMAADAYDDSEPAADRLTPEILITTLLVPRR